MFSLWEAILGTKKSGRVFFYFKFAEYAGFLRRKQIYLVFKFWKENVFEGLFSLRNCRTLVVHALTRNEEMRRNLLYFIRPCSVGAKTNF